MSNKLEPMSESNSDPRRRPSVDLLITKLRNLSTLKGHPDAVLLVIRDLVHEFYVAEAKRPAHLWHLIDYNMYVFLGLMGGGIVTRNDQHMIQFAREPMFPQGSLPREGVSLGEAPQGDTENRISEMAPLLVLRKDEKERGEALGINLTDPAIMRGVEDIMTKHTFELDNCGCGRPTDNLKDWSRHVRIRIWRYLKNEFKGDEGG